MATCTGKELSVRAFWVVSYGKILGAESEQQGSLHRVRIHGQVQQGVAKLAVAGAFYLRLFDPAMPKGGLY